MRTVVLDPFNGGLAFARALVRAGQPVTVMAGGVNAFAARPRRADGRVVDRDGWAQARGGVAAGGPAVVVTGTDAGSEHLAVRRAGLPAGLIAFEGQDDVHLPLMDKQEADAIARRAGVRVPWTRSVASGEELAAAAAEAPYPVVLKPVLSHAWRAVYGDHRVLLAGDAAEAVRAGERGLDAGLAMLM